ncbi:MAG: DUF3617 domain-containing protein [Burkholderiaceae bacterium]
MRPIALASIFGMLSCLMAAGASFAQTPLAEHEPGLWELRLVDGSHLASIALGVQDMFKNLPESQRKQVEKLVGRSNLGIPTVTQTCLTREMTQRDLKSVLAEHEVDCSELDWQESGNTARFSFVCSNPQGDWTGSGRIWDSTATSFKSEATVQGKYKGQRLALDMKHEAQWMGADCKGVAPPR